MPKRAQQPLSLANSCGVLCAPTPVKLYGKLLRREALPILRQLAGSAQFGAVPARSTDLASAAGRAAINLGQQALVPVAVLVANLKAVFYSVLSEEVCVRLLTCSSRRLAVLQVGFSEEAVLKFERAPMDGPVQLARAGLPTAIATLVADWHREVWRMVRGSSRASGPARAPGPETPWPIS